MGRVCIGSIALLLALIALDARAQTLYWGGTSIVTREVPTEFPMILNTLFDTDEDVAESSGNLVVDSLGIAIYWVNREPAEIYRGNQDGSGAPTLLFDASDGLDGPEAIQIDFTGGRIYWHEAAGAIKVGNLNGSGTPTTLFDASDGIIGDYALDLVSSRIYWVTTNSIVYGNLDGSGSPITIYDSTDGVREPTSIVLDNATGMVYWSNKILLEHGYFRFESVRADKNGSGTPELASYPPNPNLIDSVNGHLYGLAASGIVRQNLDGSNVVTLYDGDNGLGAADYLCLDLVAGSLYWRDRANKKIFTAPLAGDPLPEIYPTVLFDASDGIEQTYDLAVDVVNSKIYWSDNNAESICRGNLDGSGAPTVLFNATDGVEDPTGIALDVEGGKIYWTDSSTKDVKVGNLDGSGSPIVLVDGGPPRGGTDVSIDVVANKVYWSGGNHISVRNLDGSGTKTPLYKNNNVDEYFSANAFELDAVAGMFYWNGDQSIQRAPVSGDGPTEIVRDLSEDVAGPSSGLALDLIGRRVYTAGAKVIFFDLDNPTEVRRVDNSENAIGIVVVPTLRDTVYVDFANAGNENGTQALPYDTINEGVAYVAEDGEVILEAGESSATLRISKGMTLLANNGTVRIGDPAARNIGRNRTGFIAAPVAPK